MTTTSRRLSLKMKHGRASHTPGKDKGAFCVKPKDAGVAMKGNPYKGAGIKGNNKATYLRLWGRYKLVNGIKTAEVL